MQSRRSPRRSRRSRSRTFCRSWSAPKQPSGVRNCRWPLPSLREQRSSSGKQMRDSAGYCFHVLVGPYPYREPTSGSKLTRSVEISLSIRFDLCAPPLSVLLRPSSVDRAAMPEAPVNEDRNSRSIENDVCTTTTLERTDIDPIAHAQPRQFAAKGNFTRRVAPPCEFHSTTHVRRRGPRNTSSSKPAAPRLQMRNLAHFVCSTSV